MDAILQDIKKLLIKEVDERLRTLKAADKLSSIEALEKATNIVTLINKIIDMGTDNPAEFYEKAKMAYVIASEKVPNEEKDKVLFPSGFWSMRAKQERAGLSARVISSHSPNQADMCCGRGTENIDDAFKDLIDILERGRKEAGIGGSECQYNKIGSIINIVKNAYKDFQELDIIPEISKLSELDYKLIEFIGNNGKTSLKNIYPKLMVARPTVSYHIDRLIKYGILIKIPTVIKDKPIDLTCKGKEIFLMMKEKSDDNKKNNTEG